MKIKIDKMGQLEIERAGKMRGQVCPYSQQEAYCGEWCPMFQEPDIQTSTVPDCSVATVRGCQFAYGVRLSDFTDERVSP
jgi:hypothetical protein